MKIWSHFFECSCHSEGIAMSYEDEDDGIPCVYLAFFKHGLRTSCILTFREKLRHCWHIFKEGTPYEDEVMLDQDVAKELATALFRFARYPYKMGDKRNNKKDNVKKEIINEDQSSNPVDR